VVFFGPRRARPAQLEGGVQRAAVTVKGGYSPDVITARQGVPLEMVFDRQESGDCTSRVVFPDLAWDSYSYGESQSSSR
jgi:Cu+-exporting ATPase